jgi:hypothetical protein
MQSVLNALREVVAEAKTRIATPSPSCPIPWHPSALTPVFYGVRDYGPDDGAPGACRVYFPSLDGSPYNAEILSSCGRYPLVLFAHGDCADQDQYKSWFRLPATLARAGYVVAVPQLANDAPWGSEADLELLRSLNWWLRGAVPHAAMAQATSTQPEALRSRPAGPPAHILRSLLPSVLAGALGSWLRHGWEHSSALLPPPMTGVAGHSWGALKAAMLAIENEGTISAYAGLSGPWAEWPPDPPMPLARLRVPSLLTWGTGYSDDFANGNDVFNGWPPVPMPRHLAVFADGEHWDYLQATSCAEGTRGPCELTPSLTADLMTMFFARYLPGENSNAAQIPASLIPPEQEFTPEQELFAGSWMESFSQLKFSRGCKVTISWEVDPSQTGSVIKP